MFRMNEFKLPAYRVPINSIDAIKNCSKVLIEGSNGEFEPTPHQPHLTLLRQSLYRGRVGIDVSTLHKALSDKLDSKPERYSLPVRDIENTTKRLSDAAVLAIILEDPDDVYRDEYSSIRSKLPEHLRGKSCHNIPHITLGRLDPSLVTKDLITRAEQTLPTNIEFGPLLFSSAIIDFHKQVMDYTSN